MEEDYDEDDIIWENFELSKYICEQHWKSICSHDYIN